MNKGTAIFGVILAFAVGFFIGHFTGNGHGLATSTTDAVTFNQTPFTGNAPAAPAGERFRVFPGNAPGRGSADPRVVIVEFSDFQCPFCGRGKKTIDEILKNYSDVRFYYKENPLPMHPNAKPAAEAALAALQQGPQYFWKLYDSFFDNQENLTHDNIEKWAREAGLDMGKFDAALAPGSQSLQQIDAQIADDQKEAGDWGLQGTPMFLINGRPVRGAMPYDEFKKVIDEEEAAAKADLAAGVPQDQLYATLLKDATQTPPGAGRGPQQPQRPQVAQADPNALYNVPIAGTPMRGARSPKVVIAMWSDFQCPFCSRAEGTLADVLKQYPDVAIAWHNFPLPFHPNAMPAAEAAMAANAQGKFWQMHDLLFQNQQSLDRAHFEQWAQQIGLDMTRFKADLDSHKYQAAIQADEQLGQKFGVQGTPGFFINGKFLNGAQPIEQFKTLIDAQMKLADAALAKGVAAKDLYAALVKDGKDHADIPAAPTPGAQPGQPDPNQVYKVEVGDAPMRGPKNARVTVVLFSDFQCPFCGRLEPTLAAMTAKYPKDVRVVWKQFPLPFHPNAGPAAELAAEARAEGKFWQVHDDLFKNQEHLDRPTLEKIASDNGLDMAKVKVALDTNKYQADIQRDIDQGKKFGVQGTPSMYINGKFVVGALPPEQFEPHITQAMAEADAAIKAGASPADVYDAIIKSGKTEVTAAPAGGGDPGVGTKTFKVDPGTGYAIGPKSAPVTIVEFSDFQCPFCKRVDPTVKELLKDYGPKIRVVWRNHPLPPSMHPNAEADAEAAMAAGAQGKFWEMHDLLFDHQDTQDRAHYDQWADQIGLNRAQFDADLDSHKYQAAIAADTQYGDSIDQQGVPAFYINGRQVVGAQPIDAFKSVIDDELKKKGM